MYKPIISFIIIAIIITGCSKTIQIPSSYTNQSIEVNGKIEDWNGLPVTYFEKNNAVIAISNNNDNLYIQFRTKDIQAVQAIKMSGLKLYIDKESKKRI